MENHAFVQSLSGQTDYLPGGRISAPTKKSPSDVYPDGDCARETIHNGFIKLTGQPSDLDLMIKSGKLDCSHNSKATLGALLK